MQILYVAINTEKIHKILTNMMNMKNYRPIDIFLFQYQEFSARQWLLYHWHTGDIATVLP